MSLSDISSLCPIATVGSGMGVMVSCPYTEEKAVLDFMKNKDVTCKNKEWPNPNPISECFSSARVLWGCNLLVCSQHTRIRHKTLKKQAANSHLPQCFQWMLEKEPEWLRHSGGTWRRSAAPLHQEKPDEPDVSMGRCLGHAQSGGDTDWGGREHLSISLEELVEEEVVLKDPEICWRVTHRSLLGKGHHVYSCFLSKTLHVQLSLSSRNTFVLWYDDWYKENEVHLT